MLAEMCSGFSHNLFITVQPIESTEKNLLKIKSSDSGHSPKLYHFGSNIGVHPAVYSCIPWLQQVAIVSIVFVETLKIKNTQSQQHPDDVAALAEALKNF